MTFKRLFRLLKPASTAVEIVEAMNRCGVTKHFIETLPEGVSVPLQDAIALCQADPPQTWSKPLLLLVKRSDINDVLRNNRPYPKAASGILVSNTLVLDRQALITPRHLRITQHGTSDCFVRAWTNQTT